LFRIIPFSIYSPLPANIGFDNAQEVAAVIEANGENIIA
jgi:hypothetical protein